MKKDRTITTCNRLDLETLGFRPMMPKSLPRHWIQAPSSKFQVPMIVALEILRSWRWNYWCTSLIIYLHVICVAFALGTCVRQLEVETRCEEVGTWGTVWNLNRTLPSGLKCDPNTGNTNHYLIILYLCTYIPVFEWCTKYRPLTHDSTLALIRGLCFCG